MLNGTINTEMRQGNFIGCLGLCKKKDPMINTIISMKNILNKKLTNAYRFSRFHRENTSDQTLRFLLQGAKADLLQLVPVKDRIQTSKLRKLSREK